MTRERFDIHMPMIVSEEVLDQIEAMTDAMIESGPEGFWGPAEMSAQIVHMLAVFDIDQESALRFLIMLTNVIRDFYHANPGFGEAPERTN